MENPVGGGPGRSDTDTRGNRHTPRAFFHGLVSRLPEPAVVVDTELAVLAANDGLCELIDQPPVEVVGSRLPALFPGISSERVEVNCGQSGDRLRTATDGTDRLTEFAFQRQEANGETVYLGIGRDVTGQAEREETLDQYERIFETIEDGVFTLDESFTIGTVNSAVKSMTGYSESELVGSNATLLADESTIDEAIELTEQLQTGNREVGTLTTELETADGTTLPIETRFSPFTRCDGTLGQVGVVRDISDRRRFARRLAALHDSTRRLLQVETREGVAEILASTATETLELSGSEIYLFDRSENVLRPVEASDDSVPVGPNDGPVWDAFVSDNQASQTDGERYWPLREHGVFRARLNEGDKRRRELVDILLSSAEAALARVDRESALRERESEYRQQNDQLRQLKQVNEIIRRVDRVLVEADTCEEIEQAVCEELTKSQWSSFAWLGRYDGDAIEPRTWAGRSSRYLDGIDVTTEQAEGPPAVQTARTEEPTVIDSIPDGLRDEQWRTEAISRDFQSVISVPLACNGFLYGVLTVYADQTDRFGEMLESVFVELGEGIANAIREIQSRNRQPTDSVIELELSVASRETLLSQLARRLNVTVTCEGGMPSGGTTTRLFVRIPDLDPSEIRDRVDSMSRVTAISPVSDGELYELVATGPTLVKTLVNQGAYLGELASTTTGVDSTVQLAAGTDVRTFVEQLESHHEGVTLNARRERETHSQYGDSMRSALEERLTDRQIEVLQTAYLSGFFDWPRQTTGEGVAEMLDITQPTVNRHLRVAERKLLELLFDE